MIYIVIAANSGMLSNTVLSQVILAKGIGTYKTGTLTLDISNIKGEYYIAFCIGCTYAVTNYIEVSNMCAE